MCVKSIFVIITAQLLILVIVQTVTESSELLLAANESVNSPTNPSNDEVLQRWTPSGNTNDLNLPYRHRYADYELETDKDWVDGRWQQTEWGSFLTHATAVAGQPSRPKNIVLFLNAEKSIAAMFDLQCCGIRTMARGAKLEIDPARFGLLRKPKLNGDLQINIVGESLWSTSPDSNYDARKPVAVSYRGLRLHDANVMLEYNVGEVAVTETIWSEASAPAGTIIRQIEIGPSDQNLWYQFSQNLPEQKLIGQSENEQIIGRGADVLITGLFRAPDVKLDFFVGATQLHIAPHKEPLTVTYFVWQGTLKDQAAFETWRKGFKPTSKIEELKKPAGRRWGNPLVVDKVISTASDQAYVVDDFPTPKENPFKALFFCTGIDFFKDGTAAVCTAHGDVWIVRGLHDQEKTVTWQRYATGLYQPLGLKIIDEKVYVLGNDQLTRLHDLNGDGEVDWYESMNHDLKTFGQDHAFAMKLKTDAAGQFYFMKSGSPPDGSALYRLSSDAKHLERIAMGFRHPYGMGVGPKGEITVADNEGNWVPSSKIDLITPGGFYGYHEGKLPSENASPLRPLCFLPKVADNSCGGQIWNTSDRWGDYHRGEMIHFSWGRCTMHSVLQQNVKDVHQAATVQFPNVEFSSGPGDSAFNPIDGQLYVVGLDGWQTGAKRDGCLSRVRYTGQPTYMPSAYEVHENGILIRFTQPLDPIAATKRESYHVSQWNYKWTGVYGSYHYSVAKPEVIGHDGVAVDRASILPDGKSVFLHIRGLKPVDQVHAHTDLFAKDGRPMVYDLYSTINAVAEPFAVNDDQPELPFTKENLVAWCIVPFDAKNRGPEERVEMLKRLGIRRVAYDWRDKHIPEFDKELSLYKKNEIELTGFWMQVNSVDALSEPNVRCVLDALERNGMHTQLWMMMGEHLFNDIPEEKRAEHAAKILRPLAEKAQKLGCCVGLYNHGGWFGDVDHQIQIIKRLEREAIWNVGIVYNQHHGHHDLKDFPALLSRMQPYLYSLNLNGMKAVGPMILPIGQGDDDGKLLQMIKASGYRGAIGILNHQEQLDAEVRLRENISGLEKLNFLPAAK